MYNAIQDTYYKERANPHISTVIEPLSTFLIWLFTTYGDIDHEFIKEQGKCVSAIVYDLQNPITDIFEHTQELEQLTIVGNCPCTQT